MMSHLINGDGISRNRLNLARPSQTILPVANIKLVAFSLMPSAEQMIFHGKKDKDGRLLFEPFENPNNVILIKTTLETVSHCIYVKNRAVKLGEFI